MKKIVIAAVFLFIFLFVPTKSVFAGCQELGTDPASAASGTSFTVRARNCTADITPATYNVRIYSANGLTLIAEYPLIDVGSGLYIATIPNLSTAGSYQATIHNISTNNDLSAGGITVTAATGPNTTKFECQTTNGNNNCYKCTYQGATKISCSTPNFNELPNCPTDCQSAIPGSATDNFTSTNLQGSCPVPNDIDTAIGCIPIGDINSFAGFFLKWGLGIAGGVGMLFLIYASFMVMTSQGDPKRLQVGRELMTSAVSGIILLALSVFIFRILGVNVLGLF